MHMASSAVWDVRFTVAARGHLREITGYLLEQEGREFARSFIAKLRTAGEERLKFLPLQGKVVPELQSLTNEFREIRHKSYRIIYRANPQTLTVRILAVVHGKREIEDLLMSTILAM